MYQKYNSKIVADKISKSFGANVIFENLSIEIHSGNNLFISGPSGCGKTTLIRCLAFLTSIDGGYVYFNGQIFSDRKKLRELPRKLRVEVGYVHQQLFLWSHLSVHENISLPLKLLKKYDLDYIDEIVNSVMQKLKLSDKKKSYPIELSGGQKQRVALARALVHKPRFLFLDEVTANLDRDNARVVFDTIGHFSEDINSSVILSSHDPDIPNFLKPRTLTYTENGQWIH